MEDEPGRDLALTSPISLRRVLSYAVLFLAIQVISTLAERLFGNLGFLAASGLSGMASTLTNLPLVFKRLPHALRLKIAVSTTLQIAMGLAVLGAQRLLGFH